MNESARELQPASSLHTVAWVLYDLANTIYSASVTFLFFRYMASSTALGITTTLSMVLAGFATPLFASMADRTGRAGTYCTFATLGCIGTMSLFGLLPGTAVGLLFTAYFLSNVFFQGALVFYNSLLPSVARKRHMGLVSGIGVGLGYLGTIFVVLVPVQAQDRFGIRPAFLMAALMFLICALPCMIMVRDRRPIKPEPVNRQLFRSQWSELIGTIRSLPKKPVLMWFLIANFFAVDVLNTAIFFYGRFVEHSFLSLAEQGRLALAGHQFVTISDFMTVAGLAVTVPALLFGIVVGFLADRIGTVKAFGLSVLSLAGGLTGAAVFSGWSPLFFLLSMACFGGLGMAGIWTAGRKLLTELVPQEHLGRYFGLYGITNKVSIFGSMIFGILMDHLGTRIAVFSQVAALLVAFFCIIKMVKKRAEISGND
ncbi:MFS transporter [Acidobacteriota bacterium]